MKTIEVREANRPLPEIARALRREFPRAGIVAVGIGRRRHERCAGDGSGPEHELGDEVTIKVVIKNKLRPLPRGIKRLPRSLRLRFHLLGQPVVLRVPVDVEQQCTAEATRYRISTYDDGNLCLASYARWTEGGKTRWGCLTAGHGMWKTPASTHPKRKVRIHFTQCPGVSSIEARVRRASHLKRDGLDAALVEFVPAGGPLNPCLARLLKAAVSVPPADDLVARLGGAGDTLTLPSMFKHFLGTRKGLETLAYFDEYRIPVQGWGNVRLRHVVESQGKPNSFVGGTSGSGILTSKAPRLALGIQSLCLDPGDGRGRRSLATSFECGLSWLRNEGFDVQPLWKREPRSA